MTTSTVGSTGRNYSTLALWAASIPGTLTVPLVAQLYNDSEFLNDVLTLSGHTTTSTNTITVTTGAGQSFIDNASVATNPLKYDQSKGVGLRSTQNYSTHTCIEADDANVFISKLQCIKATGTYGVTIVLAGTVTSLSQCILHGGDSNRPVLSLQSGSQTVTNNVLITKANCRGLDAANASGTSIFEFNTLVCLSDVSNTSPAMKVNYNTFSLKNCAIFGFASMVTTGTGGGTAAFTTCMTDLASPPTGCTTVTYANQFIGTASTAPDFKTKSTANLRGAATADATYPVDIIGTARPQGTAWDIGAYQYAGSVAVAHRPFQRVT